ncbi:aromatic acid exporter family protein [Isoptericola sp. NPDC057191]|uniref:FUSC family protein n=1 Tax=Isoptericola sp. NPDC057191 TaxID=3346041 RepID=UPI0036326B93
MLHPRLSMALRGAVAAALAWVVGTLMPAPWSEFPYYAPLGAVVATTSTLARSVRESVQTVGALLLGAAIAVGTDAVLPPDALSIAVVVGVALLCAGWRVLGEMGSWVANSAIFVLILGQGESTEYIGAYAGLVVVGAAIGIGVNFVLPPLLLTPSDVALDALRDSLVGELDDLAGWLEDKGPLEPEEWERRRRALWPTVEGARGAVTRTGEARRGNLRARRYGDRVTTQARRAEVLVTTAEVVDELVRLLAGWEVADREQVPLGPRLRPELAATLRAFTAALRAPGYDDPQAAADVSHPTAAERFDHAVDELRDEVRRASARSGGDDHLVASALVVVLRRGAQVLQS